MKKDIATSPLWMTPLEKYFLITSSCFLFFPMRRKLFGVIFQARACLFILTQIWRQNDSKSWGHI